MQANVGSKSDVWEVNTVLRQAGFEPDVINSVQFDNDDNLIVNLKGPRAEEAKQALEGHNGWNSPYSQGSFRQ